MRVIETEGMKITHRHTITDVSETIAALLTAGAATIVIDDDRGGGGGFQITHDAPTKERGS